MAKETWEADLDKLSLNDLILFQEQAGGITRPKEVLEALDRLITNRTREEIGVLSLAELGHHLDALIESVREAAEGPKPTATP